MPKRRVLGQFVNLKGRGLGKKEGVVFLRGRGWYANARYTKKDTRTASGNVIWVSFD